MKVDNQELKICQMLLFHTRTGEGDLIFVHRKLRANIQASLQVYLRDRSAETIGRAATLTENAQTKPAISSSQSTDTGPVPPCTAPGILGSWMFVGCLTSQQHASVSQGWIYSDNCMCCHTEKLQIKLFTSPSHNILTAPGRVATGAPILKSLV